jgi:transposase
LGKWVSRQKSNYNKRIQIMKDENIRLLWMTFLEKYSHLFITNEEQWHDNLRKVSQYIDEYNKLPTKRDIDISIGTLGQWISTQKKNYNKQTEIMKDENIRLVWMRFIEKYSHLFLTNEEQWHNNLRKVSQYIDEYNKLPSITDKDISIKTLSSWVSHQKENYNKRTGIMKDENIRLVWMRFLEKYSHIKIFKNK